MSATAPIATLNSLLVRIERHYPYLTVQVYTKEESLLDPKCPHLDVTFRDFAMRLSFFDWEWVNQDDEVVADAVADQTVRGAYTAFEKMMLMTGGKLREKDE